MKNKQSFLLLGSLCLLGSGLSVAAKPLVITRGGTYQGTWESLDPKVPAVTIRTSEPVIIQNSVIRGRGTLIQAAHVKANLTVRNTRGTALTPDRPLKEYRYPGRFLDAQEFRRVQVYNNELIGTSGMYFRDFKGNNSRGDTIKIMRNKARNIDGRYSTGPGTFSDKEHRLVQFVQFNAVTNIANAEIAWNEVVNEPGKSRPEELINMFLTNGTASSPIKIHNNYLQGAYNVRPTQLEYHGAGMNVGDGSAKNLKQAAGFIHAYYNQVVGTNSGIVVSAGHDIKVFSNRLVSNGYLPDGRLIYSPNIGLYIWDANGDKKRGTFFNNAAYNNIVGWATPKRGKNALNNYWFPDCGKDKSGKSLCHGNTALKAPILHAMEKAEWTRWLDKLSKAGVKVGLTGPVGNTKP